MFLTATSEQILIAASKLSGLQLATARGRSIVGRPPLRRQRSWLVVEPLPGYAPELNPVEMSLPQCECRRACLA